jgi:hypothetical protein
MLELSVTSFRDYQVPGISLNWFYGILDLHDGQCSRTVDSSRLHDKNMPRSIEVIGLADGLLSNYPTIELPNSHVIFLGRYWIASASCGV